MTGDQRNASGSNPQRRNRRPEKRPPLTHFLCLPLVNEVSLPQLERSLTAFKADHPPMPVADLPHGRNPAWQETSRPRIPHGAVRPLGTLHLTLGVMSLSTKDRFDEALTFFRSLDLRGLMREAERVAADLRSKQSSSKHRRGMDIPSKSLPSISSRSDMLTVSLESLHALPRAKAATILHASPVDPTGRLYPFCIMLRDKFIEAGFILAEGEKQTSSKFTRSGKSGDEANQSGSSMRNSVPPSSCPDLAAENNFSKSENEFRDGHPIVTGEPKLEPYAAALARKPKPRPLLLHATLVNTIYVRDRPKPRGGGGSKPNGGSKRIEFDARHMLAKYHDYYLDEACTTPRNLPVPVQPTESTVDSANKFPFVWANEIPIDSVCICEMGAKKLDLGNAAMADPASALWSARLGEKYTVVAERRIGSLEASTRPMSQGSVDGGIKLR